MSGYNYFLVILDDFSHYLWTFPLRRKSEVYGILSLFRTLVHTQFALPLQQIQCDNGKEFDNRSLHDFASTHGIHVRFSCPYTSQQNGKAERVIRTVNDIARTLLFQASMPPKFWAESIHAATYLLNRLPTTATTASCPFTALYSTSPS
jgi:histone deacetylase 1/2